ncbi:MAG: cytidylate kinase family protein [archaeon]
MKITISSLSGAGTTTACELISQKLKIPFINYTMRSLAKERGVPFAQVQSEAETDKTLDYLVDKRQIELYETSESFVTGSRLSCWLADADLYVWLSAPLETRARRNIGKDNQTFEESFAFVKQRDEKNKERYFEKYGIDINNHKHIDIEVNTKNLDAEQVASVIAAAASAVKESRGLRENPFRKQVLRTITEKLSSGKA